jgi:hypothetical protein
LTAALDERASGRAADDLARGEIRVGEQIGREKKANMTNVRALPGSGE